MAERKPAKGYTGCLIASVPLGILQVLALSLCYRDSIRFWGRSFGTVMLFIGLSLLASALIFLFFRLVTALLKPERILKAEDREKKSFADRHPFLLSVIVLSVFYLPWIIIFYPGSALYDMMYQTIQADGFIAINAHHPIFATYVIGLCSRIGLWLSGGLNLGIFLYILLQTAVCVLSFSAMLSFLKQLGAGRGFWYFTLFFLAVPPLWGGMMQFGTKDTIFTGLFVLFIVQSAKLLLYRKEEKGEQPVPAFRAGTWILYGILILLLCLYRNAVLYILAPSLLVFFLAIGKKGNGRKALAVTALLALILAGVFSSVTKRVYHTKTETGEMLTIPFQQTARFVRDHPEEVSPEEAETIEYVFGLEDYRKLGKLYYPMSSDPVKARYHWWAAEDEGAVLKEYFSVWGSQLKKEPLSYAEAALSQTCGYYTILPVIRNQKGGAGTAVQFFPDQLAVQYAVERSGGALSEDLIPESPEKLAGARKVLSDWYYLWQKIPVLSLITKCGTCFYVLLALTMFYARRKNRMTLLAVPSFLLILMAIASPVNEHIRYILPVIAALPVLPAAAAFQEVRIKENGGEYERESIGNTDGDQ